MKTEISRDSHQPKKRYSGVYQQQGRMLTDADWNELVEILKGRLNDALKDVVGSKEGGIGGTPRHRALKINDDLTIQPGHVYVDGIAAQIPGDTPLAYIAQPDFPEAPLPTGGYKLYVDVWERTVTHLMDERLRDKGLHGADTCTRKQTMAQVKWCSFVEGGSDNIDPEQSAKNPSKGNAELTVTLLKKTTQPDPCDPCAAQLDVESKTGNYLLRVEVHDVQGDANNPSEVTLKWSSENGAEQYALKDAEGNYVELPDEFKRGDWIYEFFNKTSEKHLGVHLTGGEGFPVRDNPLHEGYPESLPDGFDFVRRWDGYATFKWDTLNAEWSLPDNYGINRGVKLTEDSSSTKADKVLKLDSVELRLQLLNRVIGGPVTSDSLGGNTLLDADLVINGKLIECDQSSAKEKATAINDADADVIATANTVLEGSAPPEMGDIDAGNLKVNGKDIGKIFAAGTQSAQAKAVVEAINTAFEDKEVVASETDDVVRLMAADGRNIVVEITDIEIPKRCGFEQGTNTHYGSITLTSTSPSNPDITIAGTHPGHAGFAAGTTPAVQFVAGDYWLADVREVEHKVGSVLIENEVPQGIEHHYLTLGKVIDDVLQPNPEADRKYAFPPLTEMTRMFIAGGDGQEAMPNHPVPLPLKVGVANGEWPVEGASVAFVIEKGNGAIGGVNGESSLINSQGLWVLVVKTDESGLAECNWDLGPGGNTEEERKQQVKVQLVEPESVPEDLDYLDHPPLYFTANLSIAENVAFTPECPEAVQPTIHSLLSDDTGVDWPVWHEDDQVHSTVKDVLDALLCKLRARHIPYDPTNQSRWNDINEEESGDVQPTLPETVQEAIDDLLENLHSEDIKYPLPDCSPDTNTFKSYIAGDIVNKVVEGGREYARIKDLWDALLCHLNAAKLPYDPTNTEARWGDINDGLDRPETVQQAIDDLAELESSDIRYDVPSCGDGDDESPTVRSLLPIATGIMQIDDVLDMLLCNFKATHLPLDKTDTGLCSDFSAAITVQDALKVLCDRPTGGGCKVTVHVEHGDFQTIEKAMIALMGRYGVGLNAFNLCLLPGRHPLPSQKFFNDFNEKLNGHFSLMLCGSGMESTFLIVEQPKILLEMHTFCLQNLTIVGGNAGMYLTLSCEQINFKNVHFDAVIRDPAEVALILDGREQVHVTDCIIMAHHNKSFDIPQRIFERIDKGLEKLFSEDVVLIRTTFVSVAWKLSMYLAHPDQEKLRKNIIDLVPKIVERLRLTAEETASYDRLVASLRVKEPSSDVETLARRLAGDLDRVRFTASSAAASRDPAVADYDQVVAVMVPSARADCLFDHNDIIGRFSIYGMPPLLSPEPMKIQEMHENLLGRIESGKIRFNSTQRKLQLCNNHFTQLLVAESVINELQGSVEGEGTLEGVFETMLLSDNVFRAANNYFVSRGHSFTATRFDHESDLETEGEASQPAGIVIGDNAVYVGTVGKSNNVEFEGRRRGAPVVDANIKLYDTTRRQGKYPTDSATFRLAIV